MSGENLRERVIEYVQAYHGKHGGAPTLRRICEQLGTYAQKLYEVFPERMAGISEAAGIPVPEDRIRKTRKATRKRQRKTVKPSKPLTEEALDEVEDEKAKEALSKALEWERRRGEAEALVEAERREREARLETLKAEAKLDPKRIPAYLECVGSNPLLKDFGSACALEKISAEDGCVKAVEAYGKTYLEWCEARPANERGNPDFAEYVNETLTLWTESVRLEHAGKRWSQKTYDCRCGACGAKYEYEKGAEDPILNIFKCPNNCEGTDIITVYPCKVCREALDRREELAYDPERNTLWCSFCGSEFKVKPPAMRPKGSAYKGEDPPTNQEIKAYVKFMEECTAKHVNPKKMLAYISRHSEKLIKEYMAEEVRGVCTQNSSLKPGPS